MRLTYVSSPPVNILLTNVSNPAQRPCAAPQFSPCASYWHPSFFFFDDTAWRKRKRRRCLWACRGKGKKHALEPPEMLRKRRGKKRSPGNPRTLFLRPCANWLMRRRSTSGMPFRKRTRYERRKKKKEKTYPGD